MKPTFYEFFAGGGMARAGLGPGWRCLFANDIDIKKAAAYQANWGKGEITARDVAELRTRELPGRADLAWASFPCQDLSLAGLGAGLQGERSGAFWPFWRLMQELASEGRAPRMIVLENVVGALTSHGGADFEAILQALADGGYEFGPMVIDAAWFVPQSRPRLFIVATREHSFPSELECSFSAPPTWSFPVAGMWVFPKALTDAVDNLPLTLRRNLVWWNLLKPEPRAATLADILEPDPKAVRWRAHEETQAMILKMSVGHRLKLAEAQSAKRRMVGAAFRRTRVENSRKVQRWECRFDDMAGCLRTPAGGSSRQTLIVVEGDSVQTRLISPRETARLMGLPDSYELPSNANEAYHLTGDGVAVPVVRWLAQHILEPVLGQVGEAAPC